MLAVPKHRAAPPPKIPSAPPSPEIGRLYAGSSSRTPPERRSEEYISDDDVDDDGGDDGGDDSSYEDFLSEEEGSAADDDGSLSFTDSGDVLSSNAGGVDAEGLCEGPRPMTVELPSGRPMAYYAQVEAFHRRSILPHLQIRIGEAAAAVAGGGGGGGGGGGENETAGALDDQREGKRRRVIGLYDHFRERMERAGARSGALRQWLPSSGGPPEAAPEEPGVDEDNDGGGVDMDFAPDDDTVMSAAAEEDVDDDAVGDHSEEEAQQQSVARADVIARLPGTSAAYWAAAAPAAWMF